MTVQQQISTEQQVTISNKNDIYELENFEWSDLIAQSNNKISKVDIRKLVPNLEPSLFLLQENILSEISNLRITSINHKIPLLTINGNIEGEFVFKCSSKTKKSRNEGLIFNQSLKNYKIKSFIRYSENDSLICIYKKINSDYLICDSQFFNYDKGIKFDLNNCPDDSKFRNLDQPLDENDNIICMSLSNKFDKLSRTCETVRQIYFEMECQNEDTTDPIYINKLAKTQMLLLGLK